MNRSESVHTLVMLGRLGSPLIALVSLLVSLIWTLAKGPVVYADDSPAAAERQVAEQANALWESGAMASALEILDERIQAYPQALALHKLRGDVLATFRGPQEAVQAYERVLSEKPAALEVRWAKWSVLVRWGQAEEAIAELRRIAQFDAGNPLVHLRLAQELRKLDRLEESLESYKQAVALVPELLAWRLAIARTRFDVLDYQGAETDLQYVLDKATPGSALELAARNQRAQLYESMERGRRFRPVMSPGTSAAQLKEWAAIRADAWKLFAAARYREAEPIYRRMLALNPSDAVATHQLGLTLMELGRCEDALAVFGNMSNLNPSEEDYADTLFRMGQCYVELEQWDDAFVHFQTLYDTAVEFEESNKDVALPGGMRVLDKAKIARWLEKVRPHVPEWQRLNGEESKGNSVSGIPSPSSPPSDEALHANAVQPVKPQKALDAGAALMGRDADFNWFRFIIPASKVVRDDYPTGAHEFIPLNPGDTFFTTQPEIYLVFGLVAASYDAVSLAAQCFVETSERIEDQRVAAQDRVMTAMNDQSGYFMLTPPDNGWAPGLYRCGLFVGDRTSAYTSVDEVRFRIVDPF